MLHQFISLKISSMDKTKPEFQRTNHQLIKFFYNFAVTRDWLYFCFLLSSGFWFHRTSQSRSSALWETKCQSLILPKIFNTDQGASPSFLSCSFFHWWQPVEESWWHGIRFFRLHSAPAHGCLTRISGITWNSSLTQKEKRPFFKFLYACFVPP